ncbi:uncharacterized protein LOC124634165 [Helicoverpa zea]|uniref:uncharacterized protein LOC124634165 n=1 Tax=Helicoverpa zea TaxID=7113 RepID=UPI001F55C940|nr:uncharacterized protein LOC124634165 [Helicoverpa zea]
MSDIECVLSCDPADARRSQVSGPASVKLVTDGRAGVGDQAPVADNVTGSGKKKSGGGRTREKRPRDPALEAGSAGLSSDEEGLPAPKRTSATAASRKATGSQPQRDAHGRFLRSKNSVASGTDYEMGVSSEDPGVESCTSLGSTKAELNAAKREQRKVVAADEVSLMSSRARERRAALAAEGGEPSALVLSQLALDGVDLVLKVATKSGSLKGTFTRGLKEAAGDIKEAIGLLLNRTASDEVTKLQEENGRLRRDLEDLRQQVALLSEQHQRHKSVESTDAVAPSPPAQPANPQRVEEVERIVRLCMLQCGSMVNARLEAISQRLPAEILRPPLAADSRRAEGPPRPVGKPVEDTGKPAEGAPPNDESGTSGSKGETWAKVVGRKKARKAAKKASAVARATSVTAKGAQSARRSTKDGRKVPAVRAPRSEAVSLTLQPGAVERGVTYQSVIAEAKAKIKLSDLGLQSVTLRQAATGARLFEVAGAGSDSAEKADALAAKMREVLNPEDVRVSRPVKTAEVRIAGLDDSVTSEEVVAAVARSGECLPEKVRAGDIRADATGLGVVWVRCPVASAKKIADNGRLLVGWVSARVKLLQPRALRCFRCLEKGHVRAKCTAEVDRSDLCYRCGQPAHKAAQCSAPLNCSVCSAAGKPAGHKLGGGACGAPASKAKKKKKSSKPAGETSPPPQASCSAADSRPRTVAEGMESQ